MPSALRRLARSCGLVAALALGSGVGAAQSLDGSLTGQVTDASGGAIAGVAVRVEAPDLGSVRTAVSGPTGEFRVSALAPGRYRITLTHPGFATLVMDPVMVRVASSERVRPVLQPALLNQSVQIVESGRQPLDLTSNALASVVDRAELAGLPLAARSFANIAYLAPTTAPVEPSDPTKARITAVSFGGSSGLNVDLAVDGGDNNDDFIGGFLQNFSPDAMQEFVVRTVQVDADTSRTNGGSVVIATRRGSDTWHGDAGAFWRDRRWSARNQLDNPAPNPRSPFSHLDGNMALGGPLRRGRLWAFAALEGLRENAGVAYSAHSLDEFHALAQLAAQGEIPGVPSIAVPSSIRVPFRDLLADARLDWTPSPRATWFLRAASDRSQTHNDLVQQATLPSTGAWTQSHYINVLLHNAFVFSPTLVGSLTLEASGFRLQRQRNAHLGLALAFPFSSNFLTTSGFETFGDNQFVTPITAFPIQRQQQKYQLRYDLDATRGAHAWRWGVNLVHEPVLSGILASDATRLVVFPQDPDAYLAGGQSIAPLIAATPVTGGGNGAFAQNVQRAGVYAQDSWRVAPRLTVNYGLRYDTTFGLFRASGHSQELNPVVAAVAAQGLPLTPGIPHDYRKAWAPRLGFAFTPDRDGHTVLRAGFGLYYNDLAQNGWVNAFQAVNTARPAALQPGDQGAMIDPRYHTPYAVQTSAAVEHRFSETWSMQAQYQHQQGVHQYRRYEYVSGATLPASAPNISVFRTDNRSRYDAFSILARGRWGRRLELVAHYTLANATTWGGTVGELFDYVNGVRDVHAAFGPGDHGPSGEDVRHRFVLAGTWGLPLGLQLATISQFESARPFTLATSVDLNQDGLASNDRAVVNGVPTGLDAFRGTPFAQVDLRVSREFKLSERARLQGFVEMFNVLNRSNPGNNYVTNLAALPTPVNSLVNATAFCLNADCSQTRPIRSLNELRVPAGALGDFFGPGTTVGIPFAAQLGVRVSF